MLHKVHKSGSFPEKGIVASGSGHIRKIWAIYLTCDVPWRAHGNQWQYPTKPYISHSIFETFLFAYAIYRICSTVLYAKRYLLHKKFVVAIPHTKASLYAKTAKAHAGF